MADPRDQGHLLGDATRDGMIVRGAWDQLIYLVDQWGYDDVIAALHDILLVDADCAEHLVDEYDLERLRALRRYIVGLQEL